MNVALATVPILWNNDDLPELTGPEVPYERVLDDIAAAGYEGVELGSNFPRDPKILGKALADRHLRLAAAYFCRDFTQPDQAEAHIQAGLELARFLAEMQCRVMVVADVFRFDRTAPAERLREVRKAPPADFARLAKTVESLARRVAPLGITCAFHNHFGTFIETEEQIDRFFGMTDPSLVKLCLDAGHALLSGGDPTALARRYGPRISHVHLKDVDAEAFKTMRAKQLNFHDSLKERIFCELGRGLLPLDAILAELERYQYAGWLTVEQDTPRRPPAESAALSYRALSTRLEGLSMPKAVKTGRVRFRPHRWPEVEGVALSLSAEDAGWDRLRFSALRLKRGSTHKGVTGDRETVIVVLGGTCRIGEFGTLGERPNPFAGKPWALYLPPGSEYLVEATSDLDIAIAESPTEKKFPPRVIKPEDVAVEIRGDANMTRRILHLLPPEFPADRLMLVEVFTPSGNWSSYPPHKHDRHAPPNEHDLEEIYYYRVDRPEGFAIQRVYTEDKTLDETMTLVDGDLVLVPEGYHPVVAAPGCEVYYLNALAGTGRSMAASDDPKLAWIRQTWKRSA